MKDRKKATKAIILARVSSKEQEEGYSIDAQVYRLEEYCLRKGLELLKIFKFSESSTVGNRKKFLEAIDFAKKQKEIIAVVTDKVDRLQRNNKETPLLNDLIEREKIELHFYTENCIMHKYSTSQEKMVWNMFVMMAQNYVDSLRDNVNRSIAQKLRMGEWISAAPIGYLHINNGSKHDRGKNEIVVDKMRAPLVRRLFEEYATGAYTLGQMVKKIKEWGLRNSRGNHGYLCLSHVHSIIQNPFYYGVMRVQKTGKDYPHIYQAIISKELFDQCQKIRLGWNKKPFKWGGKEFIFRGLIKCATTGRVVTAEIKKKKYGSGKVDEWTYLRCWNPENPERYIYVKEDKIIEEVQKIFDEMYLEPELLEKAIATIRSSSDAEKDYYKEKIKEIQTEQEKINKRLNRLTDLFLDGEFGENEYKEKRKELEQKRDDLLKELESNNRADNNFAECLISTLQLASKAGETFRGSDDEEKRKLINLVFQNLELKGHKLIYTLRPPFDAFVKTAENGEWCTREESNP
jgi:site-specific DNA recombinase